MKNNILENHKNDIAGMISDFIWGQCKLNS